MCSLFPTYDPDHVPDIANDTSGDYDGVYVNRFYPVGLRPGSIFKVATAAAALAEIEDIQSQSFLCEGSYWVGGDEVVCEGVHGWVTLRQALMHSCNSAFAQIALELGPEALMKYVNQFQLTESLAFDGIDTAAGQFDLTGAADVNVAWGGIGQYTDTINPCRFMTFMGQICRRRHCGGALSRSFRVLRDVQRNIPPRLGRATASCPASVAATFTGNDALQCGL